MVLNSKRNKIVDLILTYLKGELGVDQEEELTKWLRESEENRFLFDRLTDVTYVEKGMREFRRYDSKEDWEKVERRIGFSYRRPKFRFWRCVAMIVVLMCVGGIFFYLSERGNPVIENAGLPISILPGSSKALLVLENGEVVPLTAEYDSVCRELKGENFVNDGKRLLYIDTLVTEEAKWHTLKVPRGGEYMLCMADGTKVILNADSKIRYPDRFAGDQRLVELEGEAFFEVRKDTLKPFIVQTNRLKVLVLGTVFNLKAYPDELQQTTLVEGKVRITAGDEEVELRPGDRATCWDEKLKVEQVDVRSCIAWVERRFVFENEFLPSVLKKLERWYDVRISIEDASLREIRFTGNLPKYESIDKVLEILELTARLRFEWNGRTLIVRKE